LVDDLVRQLAAMEPEQRRRMLSRYNPRVALELRQELLGEVSHHVLNSLATGDGVSSASP
jgi:hypothetical protein